MIEESTHSLESELIVETPERVELKFVLASLGNRFLACAIDHTIQLVSILMVLALSEAIGYGIQQWLSSLAVQTILAAGLLFNFLVIFGYFAYFETRWNGQTPGKRWLGIRVIADDGRPVTFYQSVVRNLLRLVDMMPVAAILPSYFIGILTVFLSSKSKRLGDLAGGTVVIRERSWLAEIHRRAQPELSRRREHHDDDQFGPNPTGIRISTETLQIISTFLRRRDQLESGPRAHWATKIRQRVEEETGLPANGQELPDEHFLEHLHRQLMERE